MYLTQTLKIRHRLSLPYYPQSIGKVEGVIGTIKAILKRIAQVELLLHPVLCPLPSADSKTINSPRSLASMHLSHSCSNTFICLIYLPPTFRDHAICLSPLASPPLPTVPVYFSCPSTIFQPRIGITSTSI